MTRRYYPYPRMMRTMKTYPHGMHSKHRTRNKFKEAICKKKVCDLMKGTGTLVPVSTEEVKATKKCWQIGTTLKCKRKKKGNGLPDKHKARAQHEETNWPRRYVAKDC
jgi:hypothetical protein